jgi:hypothetical protein
LRSDRGHRQPLITEENPLLWNLVWPITGAFDGSFYFDHQPNLLDQFLANMAIGDAVIKVNPATVEIFKLPAMVNPGVYPKPNPIRRHGQAGQSERILRSVPNHHDSHRGRLARLRVSVVSHLGTPATICDRRPRVLVPKWRSDALRYALHFEKGIRTLPLRCGKIW